MSNSFLDYILTKYKLDEDIDNFLERLMKNELTLEERENIVNYLRYTLNETKRLIERLKDEEQHNNNVRINRVY